MSETKPNRTKLSKKSAIEFHSVRFNLYRTKVLKNSRVNLIDLFKEI
ncbi:hypothetical protein CKA32_002050 [Geitlerinema sp. FC II]|nr:hypothetical protein CKA32_002050 [Geitlerinema sp. FC II]